MKNECNEIVALLHRITCWRLPRPGRGDDDKPR